MAVKVTFRIQSPWISGWLLFLEKWFRQGESNTSQVIGICSALSLMRVHFLNMCDWGFSRLHQIPWYSKAPLTAVFVRRVARLQCWVDTGSFAFCVVHLRVCVLGLCEDDAGAGCCDVPGAELGAPGCLAGINHWFSFLCLLIVCAKYTHGRSSWTNCLNWGYLGRAAWRVCVTRARCL